MGFADGPGLCAFAPDLEAGGSDCRLCGWPWDAHHSRRGAVPTAIMTEIDLFGDVTPRRAKGPRPKGYAARPGTGPEGQTCGSCLHLVRRKLAGTYTKCALARARWTKTRTSDVLVRSPACHFWGRRDEASS